MARRAAIVALALVLLVSICLALCQAPLSEWRSMASLRRVDGYPLYVMRYYGDYGFSRFLQQVTAWGPTRLPDLALGHAWASTRPAGPVSSFPCVRTARPTGFAEPAAPELHGVLGLSIRITTGSWWDASCCAPGARRE